MNRYLSAVVLLAASTGVLRAQEPARKLEVVLLSRVTLINGVNIEYAAKSRVIPWVSMRYGKHNASCDDIFAWSGCKASGMAFLGIGFKL